jgi:hypothetical protein
MGGSVRLVCCAAEQGVIKAALVRVKEGYAAKARLLGEEALALQEGLDAARHTASERSDENAAAAQQARRALCIGVYWPTILARSASWPWHAYLGSCCKSSTQRVAVYEKGSCVCECQVPLLGTGHV